MPNFFNANVVGISVNGFYTSFPSPVSINANYPYGDPNYTSGIQYQIANVVSIPFTWNITQLSPTVNQYSLNFPHSKKTIDFIRLLLNDNYTLVDYALTVTNCATPLNPIDIEYLFSTDYGDVDYFNNGTFNNYFENSLYGCKFINQNLASSIIKQIMIDGVKNDINLAFSAPINQIEFAINSLNKGTYTITRGFGDADSAPFLQVNKVNRDNHFPQAMSVAWIGDTSYTNANGETELVRAFEVLDLLIGEIVDTPIYQTEDDNCLSEKEYNELIIKAKAICPDCC
jgi:hypothetical protein